MSGYQDFWSFTLGPKYFRHVCFSVSVFVLFFRDLRGNKFECDCKAKWLYLWLKMTNSTVSDVLCIGPPEYQEKKLNDVTSFDYECTTTGIQNLYHPSLIFRITLCFSFRLSTGSGETWG